MRFAWGDVSSSRLGKGVDAGIVQCEKRGSPAPELLGNPRPCTPHDRHQDQTGRQGGTDVTLDCAESTPRAVKHKVNLYIVSECGEPYLPLVRPLVSRYPLEVGSQAGGPQEVVCREVCGVRCAERYTVTDGQSIAGAPPTGTGARLNR